MGLVDCVATLLVCALLSIMKMTSVQFKLLCLQSFQHLNDSHYLKFIVVTYKKSNKFVEITTKEFSKVNVYNVTWVPLEQKFVCFFF